MHISDFYQRLSDSGAKPIHCEQMLRSWLQGKPLDAPVRRHKTENRLSLSLKNALPDFSSELDGLLNVRSEYPGNDGSSRWLLDLSDGQLIESVLLPRDGVCVSTQAGCAVGCLFCMTGKSGLLRQVSSMEILAQVVKARRCRSVKKVVFMGMGEPAHNLDNVLEAIDVLGTYGAIGHKNLVLSTVGDMRVFERLPQQRVKPALALSLHTTKAALREHLLPNAPKISPEDLITMGESYARMVKYPIQYQWTLMKGINDGDDEMERILQMLTGKYAVLNLIPFNSHEGEKYQRPENQRIIEIVHFLHSRGVLTKVRNSAGQDVDAGCGQLRSRAIFKDESQLKDASHQHRQVKSDVIETRSIE